MDLCSLVRTPQQVDELFPWLRAELIRGIPHPISPAWNRDRSHFDAEHFARCWERIGFGSVTLLTGHHDGYLLYPSDVSNHKPDRDYFGEQVAACRKRDIRVMAYYSLTLDSLVGSEHPEWRVRDMEGRVHQPNYEHFSHYHWLCLNSPYRDFAVGQLDEVVSRYDVEGVWIDILYLPGHTDDLTRETCFCDHCHRRYSDWYGGEHLLDAAGTARHDEFRALTYRNFLAQLKTMLLSKERPLLLTFNGAGRRRMPHYRMCDELADLLSGEAHNPDSLSLTSKSHRNDGRPFELLSCSEVAWSANQLKPDTLIQLESLGTLIAGGTYTMGITHAPDGRLSEYNIERLARWGQWVRDRTGLLENATPVYEMGILACEGGPRGAEDWVAMLRQAHFLYNVFMDLDQGKRGCDQGLAQYRLILVPASRLLSDDEIVELSAYVRAGGRLLIEDPSPYLQRSHPGVEELVGARRLREERAYAFYLSPLVEALWEGLPQGEPVQLDHVTATILELTTGRAVGELVFQFMDKVRTSDIQTVANFWARPDQLPRYPGMVLNEFGAGLVLANAVPVTSRNKDAHRCPWPSMLGQNCVRMLLEEPMVSAGAYTRVETSLCRQPGRLVLHFLNHGFGHGEYIHGHGEREFLYNIPVTLAADLRTRVQRATVEPGGDELCLTEAGFVLPKLGVHAAVVLNLSD